MFFPLTNRIRSVQRRNFHSEIFAALGGLHKIHDGEHLDKALQAVEGLDLQGIPIPKDIIYCILQGCTKRQDLAATRRVRSLMVKQGMAKISLFADYLIRLFTSCGCLPEADEIFGMVPKPSVYTWNAIISAHVNLNDFTCALELYHAMQRTAIKPSKVTFLYVLKACASIGKEGLDQGRLIHNYITRCGLDDGMISNALVDMYAKCGNLDQAQEVFDDLPCRTVVSYGALIAGYAQHGSSRFAFELFERMQKEGVKPNRVIFLCIMKACGKTRALEQGIQIHNHVVTNGLLSDVMVGSALVDMYVKCGSVSRAYFVFDKLPTRNVVSWGSMIAGFVEHGDSHCALAFFRKMQEDGIKPDRPIFLGVLRVCASNGSTIQGRMIHHQIIKSELERDTSVGNTLVDMYAKCGSFNEAQNVFNKLLTQDIVSWGALITGYALNCHFSLAWQCIKDMQRAGIRPSEIIFTSILAGCSNAGLIKEGYEFFNTMCEDAHMLDNVAGIQELRKSDKDSWNSLIIGYSRCGELQEALALYQRIAEDDHKHVSGYTIVALLKASALLKDLKAGILIHIQAARQGLSEDNPYIGSSLVDMYAKCGSIDEARQVFEKLLIRDSVCWTALIAGYVECGLSEEALKCYEKMQDEGIPPDAFVLVSCLKACGRISNLDKGRSLHAEVVLKGYVDADVFVGSALVDMYARCKSLSEAYIVFVNLTMRNVVSWTALITGYVDCRCSNYALDYLEQMQHEGFSPCIVTYICILKSCAAAGAIEVGLEIHVRIFKKGLERELLASNTLIDMYAKCGFLEEAREVFDKLCVRSEVSYNALIAGFARHERNEEALFFWKQMHLEGISPNAVTFAICLKVCGNTGAESKGQQIHAEIARMGLLLEGDSFIGNSLVDMYAKCGLLMEAREVFDKLPTQDVISWTALITGYAEYGHEGEALKCFEQMQQKGIAPGIVTFVCSLRVCGATGTTVKGQEIHAQIVKKGLEGEVLIGNCFVYMYCKCGLLVIAEQLFQKLQARDIVSCNALITGYGQLGESRKILLVFDKMLEERIQPDLLTFVCILNACSHEGELEKGQMFLHAMTKDCGLAPSLDHYTCLIDLFGRSGHTHTALTTILNMPLHPGMVVWHTLMAACRKWGNVKLARQAFEHALELDEKDDTAYLYMFNIYKDADMQEAANKVEAMRVVKQKWTL